MSAMTTDVPSVKPTPRSAIDDPEFKRKMTLVLCKGIFANANQTIADGVFKEALKLCGGSDQVLSEVVQTRFGTTSKTPIQIVLSNRNITYASDIHNIYNLNTYTLETVPPLLTRFLATCRGRLRADTREDILDIVLSFSDHKLYSALGHILPALRPSSASLFYNIEGSSPTFRADAGRWEFNIPYFVDRMMSGEKEIDFGQFVHAKGIWSLKIALTDGEHWAFLVRLDGSAKSVETSSGFIISTGLYKPTRDGHPQARGGFVISEEEAFGMLPNPVEESGGYQTFQLDEPYSMFIGNVHLSGNLRDLRGNIRISEP